MEKGKQVEKKNSANGKEKGVSKGKGNGELGEGRAEEFADKSNCVVY